MRRVFIVVGALCFANIATAADGNQLSIYGVKMMEPIAIPECAAFADVVKWRKKYNTGAYPYAAPTSGPCYRRGDRSKSGTTELLVYETLEIQFPSSAAPTLGYGFDALILDGKVQAIKWTTRGLAQQGLILASLSDKFGDPISSEIETKQNAFGAKYESVRASWHLPQTVTVVFEGISDHIDKGSVAIMSEAARARIMTEAAQGDKSITM